MNPTHAVDGSGDGTIEVWINGRPQRVTSGTTVGTVVDGHGLDRRTVLAERNAEVLWPRTWDEQVLCEGDHLELLRVTAGG